MRMKRRGLLGLLAGAVAVVAAPVRWVQERWTTKVVVHPPELAARLVKLDDRKVFYVDVGAVALDLDREIIQGLLAPTFVVKSKYHYPPAVLERVVAELQDGPRCLGTAMPEWPDLDTVIRLSKVSHKIVGARLVDGEIEIDVHVLDTEPGQILREMIAADRVEFGMVGVGSVSNDTEIRDDYQLIQVAWCVRDTPPGVRPRCMDAGDRQDPIPDLPMEWHGDRSNTSARLR